MKCLYKLDNVCPRQTLEDIQGRKKARKLWSNTGSGVECRGGARPYEDKVKFVPGSVDQRIRSECQAKCGENNSNG